MCFRTIRKLHRCTFCFGRTYSALKQVAIWQYIEQKALVHPPIKTAVTKRGLFFGPTNILYDTTCYNDEVHVEVEVKPQAKLGQYSIICSHWLGWGSLSLIVRNENQQTE